MKKSKHLTSTSATPPNIDSSFRDPAGFLFKNKRGELCRFITDSGAEDYELLISSGLYEKLTKSHLLVQHDDIPSNSGAYKIIKPDLIPFVSFPFEWSFSQLKDAALLTLKIQKLAITSGMTLKDASAYNIQFHHGSPIFIDTLSFERHKEGEAWAAYRQFCQHFLAPLSLMSYTDADLSQLFRVYLDGIPLSLAAKLLPARAKLKPGIALHIKAHSMAQKVKEGARQRPTKELSKRALLGIVESLENTINGLKLPKVSTEWGSYYDQTNYSSDAADKKGNMLSSMTRNIKAKTALDLGGNNGKYSRVLNDAGIFCVCTDIDHIAVEENYQIAKKTHTALMLPLRIDLTNPGGSLGWSNKERQNIEDRFKTDVVIGLALIHHLAISNNLPLLSIAHYFSKFAPYAIVEFVPKGDTQVDKLLSTRKDIFDKYTIEDFEEAFKAYFEIVEKAPIPKTKRTLYCFKRRIL